MKINLKFLSFFFFLFFISFVSANGLFINETSIQINKTENIDYVLEFNIKNTEPFKIVNITSSNNIIEFDTFDLNSGENKTITAIIKTNNNFNEEVRIRGEYLLNIGASNQTETIEINYDTGFSKCNLNMIVGDKIIWVNNVNDEIKLKNADTNNEITTILEGDTYEKYLARSESFNYFATIIGLPFTETCNINVMNNNGLVHNSEYDAVFNLNINMIYNPTSLEIVLFTDDYNMSYDQEIEDVLKIKNTGSKLFSYLR